MLHQHHSGTSDGNPHYTVDEKHILQQLGYNTGRYDEHTDQAVAHFSRDHRGAKVTLEKLTAARKAAQNFQRESHDIAPTMTLAQAHGILVAQEYTNVDARTILNLAVAQRAFDPSYISSEGRQPGMIQMSDNAWLSTLQKYGKYFDNTRAASAEMYKGGHPIPVEAMSNHQRDEFLALRDNTAISAEIGSEYAKHGGPIQIDTMNAYLHCHGVRDAHLLESFFSQTAGINNFNPSTFKKGADGKIHQTNPWCEAFMNSALAAGGAPQGSTGNEDRVAAASFLNYGSTVKNGQTQVGDVVVFKDTKGVAEHVGLVTSINKDGFDFISGNHYNAVSIDHASFHSGAEYVFRHPPPNAFELTNDLSHTQHLNLEARRGNHALLKASVHQEHTQPTSHLHASLKSTGATVASASPKASTPARTPFVGPLV